MPSATATKTVTKKVVKKKPAKKVAPATRARKVVPEAATDQEGGFAYIPDPSIQKKYVTRKVNGIWDVKILDNARENSRNVLLMGDTGSGKTLFGEAYASGRKLLYYSVPCDVSIDSTALFGKMQPTEVAGRFKWQDGPVTTIVRGPCGLGSDCKDEKCQGGVLNLSEINFMPPKIASSLYSLLDGRRYLTLLGHEGEVLRMHPRSLVIADMNPNYRGTQELNAAFKNRFAVKIQWGYNDEVEEVLIKSPTLRELAGKIRAMIPYEIQTPVSTNMLMDFEAFALDPDLSLDFAVANFVSSFGTGERDSVSKLFDLNITNLKSDLKFTKMAAKHKADDDDEDIDDFDFEQEVN